MNQDAQTIHFHRIYREIKSLVQGGRAIAFVGSGLSSHVYPSWEELVIKLCEKCHVRKPPRKQWERANVLMAAADRCQERAPVTYYDYIKWVFSPQPVYRREAYELLADLEFAAYVTTNFDPMLEDALRRHKGRINVEVYPELYVSNIKGGLPYLCYLHGRPLSDKKQSAFDIVLGAEKFSEAYCGGSASSFMQQLSLNEQIVFFGAGLKEPLMNEIMQKTNSIKKNTESGKCHYAFLSYPPEMRITSELARNDSIPAEQQGDQEDRELAKCGVDTIRYQKSDRFHSAIEEILRDIQSPKLPVPEDLAEGGLSL